MTGVPVLCERVRSEQGDILAPAGGEWKAIGRGKSKGQARGPAPTGERCDRECGGHKRKHVGRDGDWKRSPNSDLEIQSATGIVSPMGSGSAFAQGYGGQVRLRAILLRQTYGGQGLRGTSQRPYDVGEERTRCVPSYSEGSMSWRWRAISAWKASSGMKSTRPST